MSAPVLDRAHHGGPPTPSGPGGRRAPVVVAGVSAGPRGEVVAGAAADLAVERGARLVVVHARAVPFDALAALCGLGCEASWGMVAIQPRPAMGDLEIDGRRAVSGALVAAARCGPVQLDVRVLPSRATRRGRRRALATVLSAAAASHGADVVVLGSDPDDRSRPELASLVGRRSGVEVVVVDPFHERRPLHDRSTAGR